MVETHIFFMVLDGWYPYFFMVLDGLLMFDTLRMDGLPSTSTIQTEETILQTFKARLGGASKGAVGEGSYTLIM